MKTETKKVKPTKEPKSPVKLNSNKRAKKSQKKNAKQDDGTKEAGEEPAGTVVEPSKTIEVMPSKTLNAGKSIQNSAQSDAGSAHASNIQNLENHDIEAAQNMAVNPENHNNNPEIQKTSSKVQTVKEKTPKRDVKSPEVSSQVTSNFFV